MGTNVVLLLEPPVRPATISDSDHLRRLEHEIERETDGASLPRCAADRQEKTAWGMLRELPNEIGHA